jgi:MOSC domain-containing protein YiiM
LTLLLSINIGGAEPIAIKSGQSGIRKYPVPRATVGRLGLSGDVIVDTQNHGGADQAVYIYTKADYDWWRSQLGIELAFGTFGENLTLDDWPAEDMCVGDQLQIGPTLLEVTSPRIPCVTLEARMGIKGFSKTILRARRPGPYLRVIACGDICLTDTVILRPVSGPRKRLLDWPGLFAPDFTSHAQRREWLAAPVHTKLKADLEAALAGPDT